MFKTYEEFIKESQIDKYTYVSESVTYVSKTDDRIKDSANGIIFNDAPHASMAKATVSYAGIESTVKVPADIYEIVSQLADYSIEKSIGKPSSAEMKKYKKWVKEIKSGFPFR